jgi:hypothetical protein
MTAPRQSFTLDAIVVASPPGQIRLLLDSAALDFDARDVLSLTALPCPETLDRTQALLVRAELLVGARLTQAGSASAYEQAIWRRGKLFATEARRALPPWTFSDDYRALEREFFARHGIVLAHLEAAP